MRKLILIIFCLPVLLFAGQKASESGLVGIELVSEVNSAMAGNEFTIGIKLKMKKGWHIYWKNPGDSGYLTEIHLDLPQGITAGETIYPVPKKIAWDGNANYGYEGEVMLMKRIKMDKGSYFPKGLEIKGKATYLVCKEKCIPGEGSFAIRIEYDSKSINKKGRAEIEKSMMSVPLKVDMDGGFLMEKDKMLLKLQAPGIRKALAEGTVLLPLTNGIIENGRAFELADKGNDPDEVELVFTLDPYKSEDPAEFPFVLVSESGFPAFGNNNYIETTVKRSN